MPADISSSGKTIKCVVWDLDNTLWEGVLLESGPVRLKPGIAEVIRILDERGILHSIASRNDPEAAANSLRRLGIASYFLCPEIGWSAKSSSLARIRENLNIGMDTILFVDDDPFERDEVKSEHPDVTCLDAAAYRSLPEDPRLNPGHVTEDSKRRRLSYLEDMARKQDEEGFQGPKRAFLESLRLRVKIARAEEADLRRAEELTLRTNQLNATGRIYEYEELLAILASPRHELLVCELEDKYGSYGKVGLALLEQSRTCCHIRLFLVSCRVMNRGVGTVLLTYIMQEARSAGRIVRADFRNTGRNRMTYVTFRLLNFRPVGDETRDEILLENHLDMVQAIPPYVELRIPVHGRIER